jgi:hypothetical protein
LLSCGYISLLKKLGYECFPSVFFLGLAGHECQSSWDSVEADIFRDEPASLSANMGVLICCGLMHINTDELSEQGMINTGSSTVISIENCLG